MPPLRTESGVATSTEEKSHAFRARFYPMTDADLSDIPDCQQLHPRTAFDPDLSLFPTAAFEISNFVSLEEIEEILGSKASFNAPGPDFIPFGFLKAMGPLLVQALQVVTNSCWTLGHFPARFKQARTVVIRKPGKKTYDEAGAWRPIALLSTFGKIIETLAAQKLQKVAEDNKLLPNAQMGNRTGRSTDSALDLLTSQVRTVVAIEEARCIASIS